MFHKYLLRVFFLLIGRHRLGLFNHMSKLLPTCLSANFAWGTISVVARCWCWCLSTRFVNRSDWRGGFTIFGQLPLTLSFVHFGKDASSIFERFSEDQRDSAIRYDLPLNNQNFRTMLHVTVLDNFWCGILYGANACCETKPGLMLMLNSISVRQTGSAARISYVHVYDFYHPFPRGGWLVGLASEMCSHNSILENLRP